MKRRKKNSNLKKYYKINIVSSVIWILMGIGIIAFGIYYSEIFEKIFGVLAILVGSLSIKTRKKPLAIRRYEERRLLILAGLLVIYSLVNPLGNIAILFDLFKRDFVMRGKLDEKV